VSDRLWLAFGCSTPGCGWSAWVEVGGDPDGPARVVLVAGGRPTCPECGCRTLPDWLRGPVLAEEEPAA
jgi:hypothetical protein